LTDLRGASTVGGVIRTIGGDEAKEIKLVAGGYGATITVRVLVY